MKKSFFVIKERADYLKLLTDLHEESKKVVNEIGESLEWLQFAQKGKYSYFFLPKVAKRLTVLQKIAETVHKKNPYFRFGHIVDDLSYRVNTSVLDEIVSSGQKPVGNLDSEDKYYLNSQLIKEDPKRQIARYSWIKFIGREKGSSTYKDLTSGKFHTIKKTEKFGFVYFELFNHHG